MKIAVDSYEVKKTSFLNCGGRKAEEPSCYPIRCVA